MPKIFGIQIGKPSLLEMAIDEAIALMGEEDYDAAIEVLEQKALGREPDNRRALLHLGIAHMVKGNLDTAESLLQPLTQQKHLDSERAAAEIALEKVARERAKRRND